MEVDPAMQAWNNVVNSANALELSRQKNRKVIAITGQTTVKDTLNVHIWFYFAHGADSERTQYPRCSSNWRRKICWFRRCSRRLWSHYLWMENSIKVHQNCCLLTSRKLWSPSERGSGWPTMEALYNAPISKLVSKSSFVHLSYLQTLVPGILLFLLETIILFKRLFNLCSTNHSAFTESLSPTQKTNLWTSSLNQIWLDLLMIISRSSHTR